MNIGVLLKQTFDTEEKLEIVNGALMDDGVKYIINPYDEYAVEEAIRLKEQHGGVVTVMTLGPSRAAEALRTALAMGADRAIHVLDGDGQLDEYGISHMLAAIVRKEQLNLVIGGFFSVDQGAGQVAIRIAQLLDIPHVSAVTSVEINEDKIRVMRDAEGDTEYIEVQMPALLTAQQGLNEPRYPSLPGIMKAKKKPFQTIEWPDVGLTGIEIAPKVIRTHLSLPPERKAGVKLSGTVEEQAKELVRLLREVRKLDV